VYTLLKIYTLKWYIHLKDMYTLWSWQRSLHELQLKTSLMVSLRMKDRHWAKMVWSDQNSRYQCCVVDESQNYLFLLIWSRRTHTIYLLSLWLSFKLTLSITCRLWRSSHILTVSSLWQRRCQRRKISLRTMNWAVCIAFLIASSLRSIAASQRLTWDDWVYHKLI